MLGSHDVHFYVDVKRRDVVTVRPTWTDLDAGVTLASFRRTFQRIKAPRLTGRIGAGKTTLLRVLLGLLPRDTGTIRWNRELVDDPARFFVPPRSAYTPQVPRLFSDSLRNNLLLGLVASESAVELQRAVSMTQLEHDLTGLHDGLETQVGPQGVALSGGQVQRAAAARMLVRGADLLVLDDLTSLDGPTENALWHRLRQDRSRTILAASHSPAALTRADRIIVLRDGAVLDVGTLDELLGRCAEFRHLWTGANDIGQIQ